MMQFVVWTLGNRLNDYVRVSPNAREYGVKCREQVGDPIVFTKLNSAKNYINNRLKNFDCEILGYNTQGGNTHSYGVARKIQHPFDDLVDAVNNKDYVYLYDYLKGN